jgi:hypothetical protein
MPATDKTVLIVHAIDTEGPLYESTEASFERLEHLYGIRGLEKTPATLEQLRHARIDLGGIERQVAATLSGHLINYNDTWDKIDAMLARIMAPEFRRRRPDSFGGGWVFNWHCLDHVGFEYNPRRRDIGYHNIFDHYRALLKRYPDCGDSLQWHFHPMSTYREAHRCATSFVNSPELYQILSRRIIERNWFPSVFRAGFQTERPDSHWFLEQWLPFDISNMALDDNSQLDRMTDFRNGRSGDWRRAPADWSVYHPSHENYQLPGACRRWIGRALNVMNRMASIDAREMEKAFARAAGGAPTLVGLASHDFRDLGAEVEHIVDLVYAAAAKFPDVKFKYCTGVEGFRRATGIAAALPEPVRLDIALDRAPADDVPNLTVSTRAGKVFGPQPYLAIETVSRRFIHDNFDFSTTGDRWFYAFHSDTLPLSDVRRIGVATNDAAGNTFVEVLDVNV